MKRDGTTIYVPVADSPLRRTIHPGSGIVGTPQPRTGRALIYYQGNESGLEAFETYEARCYHAWGRMTWKGRGYPTVATSVVSLEELIEVGFIIPPTAPDELAIGEALRRHGYFGPMSFDIRDAVRRELMQPKVQIDRQDVVDEWLATMVKA
jgi:hypothetical protein